MTKPSHIFIVGSFRSGTTLLRNILNRSSEIAICGETFYLGRFISAGKRHLFAEIGDLKTDEGARKIVDYIYGIEHLDFWRWIKANIDKQQFLKQFLATDRSDKALFDLVMMCFANEKPIRGEKTPAHIHHVSTLIKWFPEAKIIHTLRDPRAIFVSEKRKKMIQSNVTFRYTVLRKSEFLLELYISAHVLLTWLQVVRLHHNYLKTYPYQYYLSKYEDLVSDPETRIKSICQFLEIDFTENMLEQNVINSSFSTGEINSVGFNTVAINRWQNYISPIIEQWITLWTNKYLVEFNYN